MTSITSTSTVGVVVNVSTASESEAVTQLSAYLSALVRASIGQGIDPLEADLSPSLEYEGTVVKSVGLNLTVTIAEHSADFSGNQTALDAVKALVEDDVPGFVAAIEAERGIHVAPLKAVYVGLPALKRPMFPCAEISLVRETFS